MDASCWLWEKHLDASEATCPWINVDPGFALVNFSQSQVVGGSKVKLVYHDFQLKSLSPSAVVGLVKRQCVFLVLQDEHLEPVLRRLLKLGECQVWDDDRSGSHRDR